MANKIQLQAAVRTLQDLYGQDQILKEAIKAQEQVLKDYMDSENIEHLDLGIAVVHFTQVVSQIFDLKKFRADFGNIDEYMTERHSRRFKVAA